MQTGAQLTAGFLLTLPFQQTFASLDRFQKGLYLFLVLVAAPHDGHRHGAGGGAPAALRASTSRSGWSTPRTGSCTWCCWAPSRC